MLNLRTDFPIKQELIDEVQHLMAQIRDVSLEVEQLLKIAVDEKVYLTRDEVAKMLRCERNKIPRPIQRARVGKQYLFDRDDVLAFVESKKR